MHKFTYTPPTVSDRGPFSVGDSITGCYMDEEIVRKAIACSAGSCMISQAVHRIPGFYSMNTFVKGNKTITKVTVATGPSDTERQRLTIEFDSEVPRQFDEALAKKSKKKTKEIKERIISNLDGGAELIPGRVVKVQVLSPRGPNGSAGKPKPRRKAVPGGKALTHAKRRYRGAAEGCFAGVADIEAAP